jgi:hypothetical protein
MKSPKERQHAYREQRKEHKNAGLTKLKILASATTVKRLDILSEIDNIDVGNVLGQAVELIWTQRFGNAEIAPAKAAKLEKPEKEKAAKLEKPEKEKAAKLEKSEKPEKPEKPEKSEKLEKEKAAKPEKPKTKSVKPKGKSESENPILAAKH